jgi:hypothetical protein
MLILRRSRFDRWYEWLPSFGWVTLLVVPMLMQLPNYGSRASIDQLIASGTTLLLLLMADCIAWARLPRCMDGGMPGRISTPSKGWAVALAAIVLASTIASLLLMPRIPLLVALAGQPGTYSGSSEAREVALKLGPGVKWLAPACAISIGLLAPISVLSLWMLRYRITATAMMLWSLAYAVSTTAKFPAILLMFGLAMGCSGVSRRAAKAVLFTMSLGLIAAATCLMIVTAAPSPMFAPEVIHRSQDRSFSIESRYETFPASIADRHRVWSMMSPEDRPESAPLTALLDRLLYRALFTPADVSIRWFEYYCPPDQRLGLLSLIDRPAESMRPSRIIGHWAYRDRFPTLYLDSANAYASLDADAYARGGLLGAVFAASLLAVVRLMLLPLRGGSFESRICYGVSVSLLFLLPAQASLQAILVIYGLGLLVLLSAWRWLSTSQDFTPPHGSPEASVAAKHDA